MSIDLLRTTRKNLVNIIDQLSNDQLFTIPDKFNNHIFWNFAHCVAMQHILCYKLSGLELSIDSNLIEMYRKGSSPTTENLVHHVDLFKNFSLSTVDLLESDIKNGIFKNFQEYPTSYGYVLRSIDDAIKFNNVHEAMHLGAIKSIQNLLK